MNDRIAEDRKKTAWLVYESMLGERNFPIVGVEDAFAEGGVCEREYEKMREAYACICQRLGVGEEDAELDGMIDSMERICRELCMNMFDYGVKYAMRLNRKEM